MGVKFNRVKFSSFERSPLTSFCLAKGAEDVRSLIASLYEATPKPELAYGISDMDALEHYFPEYRYTAANQARLAAGVPSLALYTSERGPIYTQLDHLLLRESRFLPPDLLHPCGDLSIIGDTVVFMRAEHDQLWALAIKNAAFADQMKGVFRLLWASAKPGFTETVVG